MGVERSTFLIDDKGKLRQQWRKVRVNGHAAAVLQAVKNCQVLTLFIINDLCNQTGGGRRKISTGVGQQQV